MNVKAMMKCSRLRESLLRTAETIVRHAKKENKDWDMVSRSDKKVKVYKSDVERLSNAVEAYNRFHDKEGDK